MIIISIKTSNGNITGFTCRGHSGYAPEGGDIVCAAVTSAIRLAEATISDILGINAKTAVRHQEPFIGFELPDGLAGEEHSLCQIILSGLTLYLSELKDEYPGFIQVMEV